MRMRWFLAVVVATSSLTACADQGAGRAAGGSGVAGEVLLGPQCPVETAGDSCRDAPAAGAQVTVARQLPGEAYAAGEVVARTATGADGSFRVDVAPGEYVVTADAGMSCELMDVRVAAGSHARVVVPCDTGIR